MTDSDEFLPDPSVSRFFVNRSWVL